MQQVADWLEKLGLGQYAQRFAENDISFSVLPDLTDQDLKEIGVSLGHRRQLLRAITELTSGEKDAPKPTAASAAPAASQETAERRQVTVMFCDLVGSTALAARMRRALRRQVLGQRLPLATRREHVEDCVENLANIHLAPTPPRLAGGIIGSTSAHSASVRSLGYRRPTRHSESLRPESYRPCGWNSAQDRQGPEAPA
jgi:SAM domain (Sterile alpha motif)